MKIITTRKHLVFLILISLVSKFVFAQEVYTKKNNIYYRSKDGNSIQLTHKGYNRYPVLSPDGELVAFLRKSEREAFLAAGEPGDFSNKINLLADQIWIVTTDGKKEWLVCKDRTPIEVKTNDNTKKLKRTIAHIRDLEFSPNSKKLYFASIAWVTSDAIHSVNIDGTNEQFISSGGLFQIISKGGYKGYLITRKHKYFITGGSYDWLWLLTPEGKEVGPLGNFKEDIDWDSLFSKYSGPTKIKKSEEQDNNVIHLKYNNPINSMKVQVIWKPNELRNGYVIGPAIIEFTNIEYGTSSTVVNNLFGIKKERMDGFLRIEKEKNVHGDFVGNYIIQSIANKTINLNYKNPKLREDRYTFRGATNEPFFFYDLDFDGKEELIVSEMFNGQRHNSTFKAYKLDEGQNINVLKDSFLQLTYEKPYIDLDELSTVNKSDKTIEILFSAGAMDSESEIYK